MPGLDPLFLTLAEDSSQATKYLMSLSTKKSLRPQTPSILNSALSSQGADPFQPVGNRAAWKQQRLRGEASIVLSQLVKATTALSHHRPSSSSSPWAKGLGVTQEAAPQMHPTSLGHRTCHLACTKPSPLGKGHSPTTDLWAQV